MQTGIRPALASDAPRLAELAGQLGYPTSAEAIARRLPLLVPPDDAILCAVDGGEVIAWMHVAARRVLESEPLAEIVALVVDGRARSRGIGAQLVAEAEHFARARGLRELRVRSNIVRERAHAFYRRIGFAIVKTQHTFVKTP